MIVLFIIRLCIILLNTALSFKLLMDSDYLTNWKKYRENVRKKYAESREHSPKRDVPNLNISDVPSGVLSPRRQTSPRRLLDFSGSRISDSRSVLNVDNFLKKVPYEL